MELSVYLCITAADVACRQVRLLPSCSFITDSLTVRWVSNALTGSTTQPWHPKAHFGKGTGHIFMDEVKCNQKYFRFSDDTTPFLIDCTFKHDHNTPRLKKIFKTQKSPKFPNTTLEIVITKKISIPK